MSFLAPFLLVALGALALPILIHLTQRERKQIVDFPSLMFLRRIPYPSVRRQRIRNWLLLLMRLAALGLIVAAFARPFFTERVAVLAGSSGPREVVILLDRSYSMGYGTHWEQARAAARRTVGALGATDRASLVVFATNAELQVRSTTDRERVLAAIDAARLSSYGTRYGPALKLANRILLESKLASREMVLISDYQRIGWTREEDLRLPEGARLIPVSVGEADTSNISIASVMLQRLTRSNLERVTATAALVNRSAGPATNVQVRLEIDGREIQVRPATLPATGSGSVAFEPFALAASSTRGTVRTATDRLPADDAFHFVLSPVQPLPVLMVEPASAARDSSLYLTRALGVATAPPFKVDVRSADQFAGETLDAQRASGTGPAVVILNDVAFSGTRVTEIRRFVERGGGLFVVLGERASWSSDARDLLPGLPGAPIDHPLGHAGMLGELEYSHPVLELFKAPRSGDLSSARFFRHRAVTVEPPGVPDARRAGADRVNVLARFDDGTPALTERMIGRGRVVLWSSTLDNFWNDFVLRPVFVPFLHQTIRYLAHYQEPTAWVTVGQVVDASAGLPGPAGGGTFSPDIVVTPSGQRVSVAGPERSGSFEFNEPGFFEFHTQGGEGDRAIVLAANIDPSESDLSLIDPQELMAAVAGRTGTRRASSDDGVPVTAEDQERRQAVWRYLLIAGLIILGIETTLSNRVSRTG